ncbi:MAG: hypothetical protein HUU37_05930 [Bdellovibrionales bacterium]|nr:hypothetical protein [Bdellovibrionales bacterium]
MKMLIVLTAMLLPSLALADLFDEMKKPGASTGAASASGPSPSGDNVDAYVEYFRRAFAIGRVAAVQKFLGLTGGVRTSRTGTARCHNHPMAVDVKPVAGTTHDFQAVCMAHSGLAATKKVTHLIEFRVRLTPTSKDCDTDAKVREFFSQPGKRNQSGVEEFTRLNSSGGLCQYIPIYADPMSPVTSFRAVEKDWVDEELSKPERQDFRDHLLGKKTKKGTDGRVTHDNPFRDTNGEKAE